MGVKNVNIFEQHVKKIVLGVAAAGALFMGYMAVQKVTVPETDVAAGNVEQTISNELTKLEDAKKNIEGKGKPKLDVPNYVQMYEDLASSQPVGPALLAKTPTFGPRNESPVGGSIDTAILAQYNISTPDPINAEFVIAEVIPMQVATAPAAPPPGGAAAAAGGPVALETHDTTVIAIEGFIPVGKMIAQMDGEKNQMSQIPSQRRRAVVARVRVERSEDMGSGTWSKPEQIAPPQGAAAVPSIAWDKVKAEDVVGNMNILDEQFKQIVLPDYGNNVQANGTPIGPPMLGKKIPEAISTRIKQVQDEMNKAKGTTGGSAAPGSSGEAMFPTDTKTLKDQGLVPFVAWDETAKPGRHYKYYVTVEMVNPNYQAAEKLANAAAKSVPLLVGQPVAAAGKPVGIASPIQFFTMNSGIGGRAAFREFYHDAGHWNFGQGEVAPGGVIAIKINGVPIDTGYLLVDVIEPPKSPGNFRVILRDPQGNLVVRESDKDTADPEFERLKDEAKRPVTPATTAP